MNWGNLAIIIGSLGVGIGFGLQNLVNNFVSGLILIFERPISIGDVVEVGTLMGTVKRIGIRSSTIRTFNESEVIVPNSLLVSQELINWTLSDRQRRLDIPVGVAYGTDPQKVIAILQEVAEAHPKVKDYPKPFITFDGFGDSSLNFLLRIWAADFSEGLSIKTEVSIQIYKRFKEENIKIPFPQHDIHIIPQKTEKGSEKQREDNKIFKDDTINGFDESVKDDDED
jgi:small-conductance mechanosensitive channel